MWLYDFVNDIAKQHNLMCLNVYISVGKPVKIFVFDNRDKFYGNLFPNFVNNASSCCVSLYMPACLCSERLCEEVECNIGEQW